MKFYVSIANSTEVDIPSIQLRNQTAVRGSSIQNSNQVSKKCFPYTQLKLMQKINNEHTWDVKITAKFINKCILRMEHEARINIDRELDLPVLEQRKLP